MGLGFSLWNAIGVISKFLPTSSWIVPAYHCSRGGGGKSAQVYGIQGDDMSESAVAWADA